ncbi:O-antigen polysaccharide polymerase Wzy, partial [[Clostridium] innocuum]
VSFKSQYPYIIYVISTFTKFSLYFYLATLPSKKHTFVPLVLYILSAVPSLIVGERNPIVLNTIFALIYYVV